MPKSKFNDLVNYGFENKLSCLTTECLSLKGFLLYDEDKVKTCFIVSVFDGVKCQLPETK